MQFSEFLDKPLPALFCGILRNVQQFTNLSISRFQRIAEIDKMPIIRIKLIYYLSQPMYVRVVNTFICNIVRVLVRNIVPVINVNTLL